jgi:hypothetical protein
MPTFEVTVEMAVTAKQTVRVNALNELDAVNKARAKLDPDVMAIDEDRKKWSIRSSRVDKMSSVIVPLDKP